MKILFLSRWFPYPPDNGSKIRIFNLLKEISNQHEIYLISFTSTDVSEDRIEPLSAYCRQIETIKYKPFRPHRPRALLGFFSRQPRSFIDTHNLEFERLAIRINNDRSPDIIIASEIDTAPYALSLAAKGKILEDIELSANTTGEA